MTPSEVEKEFEEFIELHRRRYHLVVHWALKEAFLEAHSRQQEKIEKLKEGIRELLCNFSEYLPDHVIEGLDKLLDET